MKVLGKMLHGVYRLQGLVLQASVLTSGGLESVPRPIRTYLFCVPSYVFGVSQFLLLLLRSLAIFLGFTILDESFAYVTVFNPAIEVVTFHFRRWCMLSVFLLPAFTR